MVMQEALTKRLRELKEEREEYAAIVRHYDRWIQDAEEIIARDILTGNRKPPPDSMEAKMVEELRESPTQIKALEALVRKNGNNDQDGRNVQEQSQESGKHPPAPGQGGRKLGADRCRTCPVHPQTTGGPDQRHVRHQRTRTPG